jgi:hypothetical protein
MGEKIRITAGKVEMLATLNDSETAKKLLAVLPVKSTAQRWGDEVYFSIPLKAPGEKPQASVPSGAIAYWPVDPSFCIFFGQTPYSPVNVLGRVEGDEHEFQAVVAGDAVRIEKA